MKQDFDELDALLQRAGAATDAAECHGFICGVLCAAGGMDPGAWLVQLLGDVDWESDAVKQCAVAISKLFQRLREELNSPDLEFQPLLPLEEDPLQERTESLGHWCEGFTSGLGMGGLDKDRELSEDSQEFIRDVADISRVEFDFQEGAEEDEVAFSEIQEYLRMGVLLLHDELQPLQPAPRLQ